MFGGEAEIAVGLPRRVPSPGGNYSPSAPYDRLTVDREGDFEPFERSLSPRWSRPSRKLIFPGLWVFIGLVSSWDTYLTLKFQESLRYHELNPIARMLLRLDDWDPSLLIGFKFLGTFLALGLLTTLHLHNPRVGLLATVALAALQLVLLSFLVLA